jgi:hypothetical protein
MAKIVDYSQRTQAPVGGGVTPQVVPIRRTDPWGATFRDLSGQVGALEEREEERARAWSAEHLSAARLEWTEEMTRRQQQAGPGAPDFTPGVLSDFDKRSSEVLESAPNETARRFMNQRFLELRTAVGTQALQFESQAQIDHRSDQFKNGIQNVRRLMNSDPGQYEMALAEQLAILDASAIPSIQKSALKQYAMDTVSQAAVASQIQRSPTAFLQSIGFLPTMGEDGKMRRSDGPLADRTGNMAFDALPFDKRMGAFDSAIKAHNQLEMDAERGAKTNSAEAGANALKKAYALKADGGLTRAYVDSIAPIIKASEYESLLKALTRPESVTTNNRNSLDAITKTIYGDPYAAERMIHAAYQRGDLTDATFTAERARAHSLQRQGGPKSEYEMSRNYITTSLDPGPYVQDPIGKARFGDAIDTFDRWIKSGTRTDDEIYKRGREIVNQYRFINLSDTVVALPSPRSGRIRRAPNDIAGMRADIAAAAREAEQRRATKKFTPEEYDNEMQIIDRWVRTVEELNRGG